MCEVSVTEALQQLCEPLVRGAMERIHLRTKGLHAAKAAAVQKYAEVLPHP